jgi:hypothetical protein
VGTELALFDSKQYPLLDPTKESSQAAIIANLGEAGPGEFDLERIRMPGGGGTTWVLTKLDGSEEEVKDLDCVLLMWKNVRAFWQQSFDDTGGGVPPACSSQDSQWGSGNNASHGGVESLGRHSCQECPQSKFGSASKGNGQACKQMKVLFALLPGNMLPHALFLPPTSLKAINAYMLRLASQGLMFCDVVTRLSLEKTQNADSIKYSQIKASMVAKLDDNGVKAARVMVEKLKPSLSKVIIEQSDVA